MVRPRIRAALRAHRQCLWGASRRRRRAPLRASWCQSLSPSARCSTGRPTSPSSPSSSLGGPGPPLR
eukprot:12320425-Alexandrium_andersonii.AAC.1